MDENGEMSLLQFANPKDRASKNGSDHKVLNELSSTNDNISKLAVIHIDEIVSVSEENSPYHTKQDLEENHGWLDKGGWLHRNANVINARNGNIYNLTVDIAKAKDGRTILYATHGKIKKVGNAEVNSLKIKGSKQNSNFDDILPQNTKKSIVNLDKDYLDAVNRGDTDTAQKIVDDVARENGYTIDAYHGTTLIASGNAKYSAEVVVGITSTGEAVYYDVVDMTPAIFDIKNTETSTTATTQNAIGDINEISAELKIPQNFENVNANLDKDYLDAVSRGETETAQKIVDDVARENGYTIKAYHGTNNRQEKDTWNAKTIHRIVFARLPLTSSVGQNLKQF